MAQAKVSMAIAEKVGLPNYSNVDIGPAVVERIVDDTPEAIAQALAECALHAQKIVFTEAEEIRRRGAPREEPVVEPTLTSPPDRDASALRSKLLAQIQALPQETRAQVKLRLVGLGVTNPSTPQEALAVLDVEKLSYLESWLTSLLEESHA